MLALLALALLGIFLTASLALWGVTLVRVGEGRPILERDSHRPAVWGFVDLIVTVVILLLLQVVAAEALRRSGLITTGQQRSLDDYFIALMVSAGCSAAAFGFSWVWLSLRTGASAADLGFRVDRFWWDIAIGVAAFVMLAPVVFGVQLILVLIMGPTQHPLILLLQKSPEWRLFLAASLNAVIVAPVVEEYFFRSLWQGWTESLRLPMHPEEALLGCKPTPEIVSDQRLAEPLKEVPAPNANPYAAPVLQEMPARDVETAQVVSPYQRTIWWPILVSATLFALAHFSHGPDGVALFVLAVGLGYLYQRTRSLTPSIVVHFLLNATSMIMLWTQLFLAR